MVVELRDRLSQGEALEALAGGPAPSPADVRMRHAMLALISLAYKQVDAHKAIQQVMQSAGRELSAEELLRMALKRLV